MSLEKIKEIKRAVDGATVNDVVITLCGGALRRYLEERNELPASSLLASVPVSVREESKKTGGSNKVSTIFSRLGTDIADPIERLKRGLRGQPQRQGPPQDDPGGHPAGLGRVRRSADLRPRGADGLLARAGRLRPGDPQPGDLQRARAAGPAVLHGRQDRGALPARTDLPRRRPEHHRDVQREQDARGRDRLPRAGAAAVEADREVPRGARGAVRRNRRPEEEGREEGAREEDDEQVSDQEGSYPEVARPRSQRTRRAASKKTASKTTTAAQPAESYGLRLVLIAIEAAPVRDPGRR